MPLDNNPVSYSEFGEVGATTIVKEDITASGARAAAVLPNISRTYHQIAHPLITPDEVMRLRSPVKDQRDIITEPGDMLIFVAGHAPILGTQSLYFRDPIFSERAKLTAPTGTQGLAAAKDRKVFKL